MQKIFYTLLVFLLFASSYSKAQVSSSKNDTIKLWTAADRNYLVSELISNRDSIIHYISRLNNAQWSFHENASRWSIAEIFEHLERYEYTYFKEVTVLAGAPMPDKKYLQITTGNDQFFKDYETDTVKVTTSNLMEPIGRFATKEKAIESFLRARNGFIAYIQNTNIDLRRYFAFRGYSNTASFSNASKWNIRDLHQLVLTDISHAYRHMHQMEKVTKHNQYPTGL